MNMYERMMKYSAEIKNTPSKKTNLSEADRLKRYFATFLPEGVNEQQRIIRILPPLVAGDGLPFEKVDIHSLQVNGKWTKFVCAKEVGKPCAFCDTKNSLYESGTDGDKALAKNYFAKGTYVFRLVERGKEQDGVKFWRFNHDNRNTGIFDKLLTIMQMLAKDGECNDITDVNNGIDIIVDIARDQKGIPTVRSIMPARKTSRLMDSDSAIQELLEDQSTWKDVYSVKPYEYSQLIVEGSTPIWNSALGKYVSKEESDTTTVQTNNVTSDRVNQLVANGFSKENVNQVVNDATGASGANQGSESTGFANAQDEDDDDLPF